MSSEVNKVRASLLPQNKQLAYTNLIKLTRPGNLMIVALTMFTVRYAMLLPWCEQQSIGIKLPLSTFEFLMLVLVAVSLTAAGNIINDYFDQKVDKINKPERLIVGTKVKRRVAIVLHQALNVLAVLLTIVISIRSGFYWPVMLPVVIASVLWWYSPVLKKKFLLGNLAVAFCTATVIPWSVLYDVLLIKKQYSDTMIDATHFFLHWWVSVWIVSGFAFILTLVREVQKDAEDMEGDQLEGYHTYPILKGIAATRNYATILLVLFIVAIAIVAYVLFHSESKGLMHAVLLSILTIPMAIASIFKTRSASTREDFKGASKSTKVLMLGGIIYLIIAAMLTQEF